MKALKKVLVVDDDPVVTRSFDRVLSSKGYAVITASNGEEALKKIAADIANGFVTKEAAERDYGFSSGSMPPS